VSDQFPKAIFDPTDQLVFCASLDTTLIYANPAAVALLELPDNTTASLISKVRRDYSSAVKQAFHAAVASGTSRGELAFSDNSEKSVYLEGSLSSTQLGNKTAVVGIFNNITDRKRVEDVLTRQADICSRQAKP